jgi:hypothetical protein
MLAWLTLFLCLGVSTESPQTALELFEVEKQSLSAYLALCSPPSQPPSPSSPIVGLVNKAYWLIRWGLIAEKISPLSASQSPPLSYHKICGIVAIETLLGQPNILSQSASFSSPLGLGWLLLSVHYLAQNQTSYASLTLSESRKYIHDVTARLPFLDVIGPFPIGKTELDGVALAPYGGIERASLNRLGRKEEGKLGNIERDRFPSELVEGGFVTWSFLSSPQFSFADVDVDFPGVKWSDIAQGVGIHTLEVQSYYISVVGVTRTGRYSLHCRGISSFYFDGIRMTGDQYGSGDIISSITLTPGFYTIILHVRSKVRSQFSCSFSSVRAKKTLRISQPRFLPDLIENTIFSDLISVPLLNLSPYTLKNLSFIISNSDVFEVASIQPYSEFSEYPSIAPGQFTFIPLRIRQKTISLHCSPSFELALSASPTPSISSSDLLPLPSSHLLISNSITIQLRCRKSFGESFIFTFFDADGSVSHAGAIPPSKICLLERKADDCDDIASATGCPIVVASHGTGVTALSMADSFKYMEKGKRDYTFGFENMWILTPTRHGAHNHQNLGTLVIHSAIDALSLLTAQTVQFTQRLPDRNRLISTGHSMGGHGSFHFSTHFPDRLICSAPVSGWTNKEVYGDSNRLFEEDISVSHSDAKLQGLLRLTSNLTDFNELYFF